MTLCMLDRTVVLAGMLTSLLFCGCIPAREPWGGCPFEDVEVSSDFVTPWETVLGPELEQLQGPHPGVLAWHDGENVVTVPRAGESVAVEAVVEADLTTASMRMYHSTEETPVCESDEFSVDAVVSFVRVEDGEVELRAPVTFTHGDSGTRYIGDAELSVSAFDPGLVPLQEFPTEMVTVYMDWSSELGWIAAEFDYYGERSDTPGTGAGVSQLLVDFVAE